ncbi:unnamed protein product, partial [Laminaria digitata]
MRRRLLDLIVCPRTKSPLTLRATRSDGEEILEGALVNEAGDSYPIVDGVPRLLPEPERVGQAAQRTVDRFGEQWYAVDFMGPHYEEQFLGWLSP